MIARTTMMGDFAVGTYSPAVSFVQVQSVPLRTRPLSAAEARRRTREVNKRLNANWDKAVAHATQSTRRLIGRDAV